MWPAQVQQSDTQQVAMMLFDKHPTSYTYSNTKCDHPETHAAGSGGSRPCMMCAVSGPKSSKTCPGHASTAAHACMGIRANLSEPAVDIGNPHHNHTAIPVGGNTRPCQPTLSFVTNK